MADFDKIFLSTLSLRRATLAPGDCFADLVFLSTLSLRRATAVRWAFEDWYIDFYPRSPCGERLRHSAQNRRV